MKTAFLKLDPEDFSEEALDLPARLIAGGELVAFPTETVYGLGASALDGIFQGFGNMVALTIMCVIREFLGAGTFGGGLLNGGKGIQILPPDTVALGMILPVGGFLTLGVVIAAVQYFMNKPKKTKEVAK